MPDQKTKDALKNLCEEVAKGEKDVEEIEKFFGVNREAFFEDALPYNANVLYSNVITNMSCSCGSREDSCKEDGQGKYSTFFVTMDGTIFRKIEQK